MAKIFLRFKWLWYISYCSFDQYYFVDVIFSNHYCSTLLSAMSRCELLIKSFNVGKSEIRNWNSYSGWLSGCEIVWKLRRVVKTYNKEGHHLRNHVLVPAGWEYFQSCLLFHTRTESISTRPLATEPFRCRITLRCGAAIPIPTLAYAHRNFEYSHKYSVCVGACVTRLYTHESLIKDV